MKRTTVIVAISLAILILLSVGVGTVFAQDDQTVPPVPAAQIQGCGGDCASCPIHKAPTASFNGCSGNCRSCPRHNMPVD